jgi:hypothetical protein
MKILIMKLNQIFNANFFIHIIFCDVGLDVYYFSISSWRKGYDFKVTQFEPNNPDKVSDLGKSEYFRIYIDINH